MRTFRNDRCISADLKRGRLLVAIVVLTMLCGLFLNELPARAGSVRPYNSNSIWNRPIDANPELDPNSTAKINKLTAASHGIINIDGINGAWSVPVYYADANTPHGQVCDAGKNSPCETVPIPSGMLPSPDNDAKAVIIDFSASPQHAWSFWQMSRDKNGNWWVNRGAFGYGINTEDGDGIHNHAGGNWGGRVAGWNYLAGLILPDDIREGHIDHALELSIPSSVAGTRPQWPALGADGKDSSDMAIAIGSRLQLDPSIDVNSLHLSPGGKVIARTLQVYGAWVGDTGSMTTLDAREYLKSNDSIDSSPWWNLLTYRDLYYGLPMNRLRVVKVNRADFFVEGK